jgi:hypothetical protein
MPRRPLVKKWTEQDFARLVALAEAGSTLMHAAAALGRPASSVQKKAKELGKKFPGPREVRADLRAANAKNADSTRRF